MPIDSSVDVAPDDDSPSGQTLNLDDATPGGDLASSLADALGDPAQTAERRRSRRPASGEADDETPEDEDDEEDDEEDEDDLDDEEEDEDEDEDEEDEEDEDPKAKVTPKGPIDVYKKLTDLGLGNIAARYESADDLMDGLVNAARRVGERDEEAAYWKQLKTDEQFQVQLRDQLLQRHPIQPPGSTPGAAGAAPAAASDKSPLEPPQWRPEWQLYIENGKVKDGTDPEISKQIKAVVEDRRQLQEDPVGYMRKYFKPVIDSEIEARFGKQDEAGKAERRRQQDEAKMAAYGEDLLSAHSDWIFVGGDPRKGVTQGGQVFEHFLKQAASLQSRAGGPRYPDPADRIEFAVNATIKHFGEKKPAKTGDADAPNKGKKGKGGRDTRLDRRPGASRRNGKRRSSTRTDIDLETKLSRALKGIKSA